MSSPRDQLLDLIDNRAEFRSITEIAVDPDGGDLIVLGWGHSPSSCSSTAST